MRFTLGRYDFSIGLHARFGFSHFRIHRSETTWHMVWGKLSVHVEDWSIEAHRLCLQCNSPDIAEVHAGDEGVTVCSSCRTVEGEYKYVNAREYDKAC